MKTELVQALTTTFEAHAQQTESGIEFWLARDLQYLLGYTKLDNFLNVVSKARTSCEVSGDAVSDHFADVGKTIAMPKGAEKEVPDIMLKRNIERFPDAFMFQLDAEDWENLKCQIGISSLPAPESGGRRSGAMRSQIVTAKQLVAEDTVLKAQPKRRIGF